MGRSDLLVWRSAQKDLRLTLLAPDGCAFIESMSRDRRRSNDELSLNSGPFHLSKNRSSTRLR